MTPKQIISIPQSQVEAAEEENNKLRKENANLKASLELALSIGKEYMTEVDRLDPGRQRRLDQCMGQS